MRRSAAGHGISCELSNSSRKILTEQVSGARTSCQRIGRLVLALNAVPQLPSPCGPNCTYNVQFDGPSLNCTKSIYNRTVPNRGIRFCDYDAYFTSNMSVIDGSRGLYMHSPFNFTTGGASKGDFNGSFLQQEMTELSCISGWSSYIANISYSNGVQSIEHARRYKGTLDDLDRLLNEYGPLGGRWPAQLLKTISALNHYALISSLFGPLAGNYSTSRDLTYVIGLGDPYVCG